MVELFLFFIFKIFRKLSFFVYPEKWSVCVMKDNVEIIHLKRNKFNYFADPFVFEFNNLLILLCERYDNLNKIGYIDQYIYDRDYNVVGINKNILNLDTHSSYPFVFFQNEDIFLIPETSILNKLLLYKFNTNNYRWEFIKILIDDISIVDCNFYFNGRSIILTGTLFVNSFDKYFVEIISNSNSILSFEVSSTNKFSYKRNAGFNYNEDLKYFQLNSINYYGISFYSVLNGQEVELYDRPIYGYKGIHHVCSFNSYFAFDYKAKA